MSFGIAHHLLATTAADGTRIGANRDRLTVRPRNGHGIKMRACRVWMG
jgi:hypothetical protein